MELNSQTVHAVCEGVQAPHGMDETLCHGAQVVDALSKDNAPPGMTSLEWCHAQTNDPIINQIVGEIKEQSIRNLKIKMGMPSKLKALIRNRKQLVLKTGGSVQEITGQCRNQALACSTSSLQAEGNRRMS